MGRCSGLRFFSQRVLDPCGSLSLSSAHAASFAANLQAMTGAGTGAGMGTGMGW